MKDKKVSTRLRFPEEERQFSWLPMLLDAFAIIDRGVSLAIKEHEKKFKIRLACKKGCGLCCRTHKDIPLYPLEMVGIYWYVIEKMGEPLRGILKNQLLTCREKGLCLFQVGNDCSIHPFRPIACRLFNVFATPCAEGEDPYYTRREDVLTPIEKYTNLAIMVMLPFYGITDEAAKDHALKSGFIHTQVHNLHEIDWNALAVRMENFDSSKRWA